MVSISTLVGVVPEQECTPHHTTEKGEIFYKLKASFNGTNIPIMVSKFVWDSDAGFGKVEVRGYIDKLKNSNGRYTTFIYAHSVTTVSEDVEESNAISLYARVTKKERLETTHKGLDIRRFVTTQTTHDNRTVIIYVEARDTVARAMCSYNKNDYIRAVGHLVKEKGLYSVVVATLPEELDSEKEEL